MKHEEGRTHDSHATCHDVLGACVLVMCVCVCVCVWVCVYVS